MPDENTPHGVRRALDLLDERLGRGMSDVAVAIDELCREHQELVPVLRALGAVYNAGKVAARSPSLQEILLTRHGDLEKLTIMLDCEGEEEAPPLELEARRHSFPGRYAVMGEVARGGMGVIYRVRDSALNRTLAMKVMSEGQEEPSRESTATVLSRFLEEAQVTAQLDHPGIVAVHELGMNAEGRPFFTMKLVKGREFSTIVDLARQQKEGWNLSRAVGVLVKVCQTIAYAHSKNVIHRDLKPANIMVGRFGEVFVMDWGLAKVIGREDSHDLRFAPEPRVSLSEIRTSRSGGGAATAESPLITMDGSVVGTPAFMPPEQARGEIESVERRSDVYAIGAILYHLLAGQPPYVEPAARISPRTILARVLDGPPRPVSRLNPQAPPELVAICEKAMARHALARYGSSLDLAEDLQAWLDHRVVGAYRTGAMAELKSWVSRNRLTAAVGAAALLLLLSSAAWLAVRENANSVWLHHRLSHEYLHQGQGLCEAQRIEQGLHLFVRARDECPQSSGGLKADIEANLLAWADRCNHLIQYFDHEGDVARPGPAAESLALAFTPDGRRLVTGGWFDHTARIWSVQSGEPIGKPMAHTNAVTRVYIAKDSGHIITLTRDGVVSLWSATGEALGPPLTTEAARTAFHRSLSLLAVAARSGGVTVWSAETGQRAGDLDADRVPGDAPVTALEISRDGDLLLAGYSDATVRVWSVATGKPRGDPLRELGGAVAAFSPDASRMMVIDDGGVARLWSIDDAEAIGAPIRQGPLTRGARFSPDGTVVAVFGSDFTVRLWSAEDGAPRSAPMEHRSEVTTLAFSPDGEFLITGSRDFSARLWSAFSGRPVGVEIRTAGTVRSVAFREDGKTIAVGSVGRASVWSADVLPKPEAVFETGTGVWGVDFSPDGKKLLTGTGEPLGPFRAWSKRSREALFELEGFGFVWAAKFSPDGRYIIVGTGSGARLLTAEGKELKGLDRGGGHVRSVAFDQTGSLVATGDFGGSAKVWSVPAGDPVSTFKHPGFVEDLVFTRDGARLITACGDGRVRFWSLLEKREVLEPLVHGDSVLAVNVSPDGRLIATGSRDQTARFWDIETGKPRGPILEHAHWVEDLDFSTDGRYIVTACANGNVQLWSVESGEKIGPPFPHRQAARAVVFDPDGRHVLTGTEEPGAKLWSIPTPEPVRRHDLRLWVEGMTGMRMDERGVMRRLSPAEWRGIQDGLRASGEAGETSRR